MTEPSAGLLLVDDDEAKRYILATWLRRAGHTVTEVTTGQEALAQAAGPSWSCSTCTCPT